MKALELAIPPPLVMLVVGLSMWLLSVAFPSLAFHTAGQIWAAIVVALAGFGIATAGIIAFRRANTTFDPRNPAGTSALVTAGIYRLTRNPMYLGVLLILIGWALFLGNILALICAFIFVPYIGRYQIQPEERLLEDKFGATFTAYKARVRRWI